MKRVLCTFGNYPMFKGAERYRKSAESLNVFDEIYTYNDKDLDAPFKKEWGRYLIPYSRGFGYWCWKPYLVLQTLERMNDGDVLLYADLGCFYNPDGRKRMLEYYDIVDKSETGILGFRGQVIPTNDMPEMIRCDNEWTKGDIFDYYGVRNDKTFTHTPQFESTAIFFKKSPLVMQFVKDWYQPYLDDYSIITDEPSRSPNLEGFVENRHDQSIYSMLAKKYKIAEVSLNEICPFDEHYDWGLLKDYPIWATRNLYYESTFHYKHRYRYRQLYTNWWKVKYFFKDLLGKS